MRSYASVVISGRPIPSEIEALIIAIKIRDASGADTDSCEITLDDTDDQIVLPRRGEPIAVSLSRDGAAGAVTFEGTIDKVRSRGARGGGQIIVIESKTADMRGRLKTRREKHLDDGTFEDAARAFAPQGTTVRVHQDLAAIHRDYWYLGRVNFMHWARVTAREIGATFKMVGNEAVFVPRNAGLSASGKPLQVVYATKGVNIINWDMSPDEGRPDRDEFEVTYYDRDAAAWKTQDGTVKAIGSGNVGTYRFSAPDRDTAEAMAKSLKEDAAHERGGGTILLDGEPTAQAEAICILTVRPGFSGTYQIGTAEHEWTRGSGFLTHLELKRPKGKAGTDDR